VLRDQLGVLLEPVVRDLGYELWELEYAPRPGGGLLRLFIERPEPGSPSEVAGAESEAGITVDDCARVSHAVSEVMDAEDPVPGHYTLEVSSPGLDRVLRTQAHFDRFEGAQVRVEMKQAVNGRKRFTGRLARVEAGTVLLETDAESGSVQLDIDGIHKARLVPEL
jgi:ribosome maturation factor RimP